MGNISNQKVIRQCFSWLQVMYKDIAADHYSKKLCTGQTILLYLEATLNQRKSNEAIAEHLKAKKWLQKWLNLKSVDSATLYRKLEKLPLGLLQDIFNSIVQAIAEHYAGKTGIGNLGKLSVIDSSECTLPRVNGEWAYVSSTQNAIKMHTLLEVADVNSVCAQKVVLSTAVVADHDARVLLELVTDTANTYVFDRGYIHYGHYRKWAQRGIRFVARVKSNNRFQTLAKRERAEGTSVILDADVELQDPATKETTRLRLVEYMYEDKNKKLKRVRVLSNRWDLTAEEISEIYRYRWKIELFFKWLKQHANLKKLYNTKPQAVWNQCYLSLIAHALCELIRLTVKPEISSWDMLQKLLLYAEQTVEQLMQSLHREPTVKSKGRQKKAKRGRPRKHPKQPKTQVIIVA